MAEDVALSIEQVKEVLGLLRGADSVELKLTVPDRDQRSSVAALGLDPLDGQIRQVMFFDTPDLKLNKQGLVVRLRRIQGRPADSVVKLRPVVPDALPRPLRRSPDFGVEVDAMPGGFVCSGSMKGQVDPLKAKQVMGGERPLRKVLSPGQRDLYRSNAPSGVSLDDLKMLGPINVVKLKFTPEGTRQRYVAEQWFYPDGSRILELSTKCAPAQAFDIAAEAKAFLADNGVDLHAEQQTKTKSTLQFFARELHGRGTKPRGARR